MTESGHAGATPAERGIPLDLVDPAFLADPYPAYERLRAAGPIVAIAPGIWVVAHYQGVIEGFTDSRLSRRLLGNPGLRRMHQNLPPSILADDFELSLSQLDGEGHATLRAVAARALSPDLFPPLLTRARDRVRNWLSRHGALGPTDLHASLARPIVDGLMAELIGVPRERQATFASDVRGFLMAAQVGSGPQAAERALRCAGRIGEEIDRLAAESGDGLLAKLAAELPLETVRRLVRSLLTAGIDPLESLIGIGAWSLAEDPKVRQAFLEQPDRAVLELLRWRHVGRFVPRVTRYETDFGDRRLAQGDLVLLGIAAAHRDPALFDQPDRFDIERDLSAVRPFGSGPATCIAARLARQVGEIVLHEVATCSGLRLDGPPEWAPNPYLRGLRALPVHLS